LAPKVAFSQRALDYATGLRPRAVFHARCSLFEDLAYGIEAGLSAYTDMSLAALEWLFSA
jgi:hypothetical protein